MEGWQKPKRVWHVGCQTEPEVFATRNPFSLLDAEPTSGNQPTTDVDFCSCDYEPEELQEVRRSRRRFQRRKKKRHTVTEVHEEPPAVRQQSSPHDCNPWRPYNTCYFLPGRVQGLPVQFLIDTGCTTNLLGKHVFDRLPRAVRATLQKDAGPHGTMADGTILELYGVIELPCRLRDRAITETFVVS